MRGHRRGSHEPLPSDPCGMTRKVFRLDADACTHVGRRRQRNEDAFLLTDDLLAVADGLGGHPGGDLASATAVETLHASAASPDPADLRRAFAAAHQAVLRRADGSPDLADMCTTLCALALDPAGVVVLANLGDSRIYRLSDGRLEQVSRDHTWVNEYVNMGMSLRQARSMRGAASLSRVVGAFPEPCETDVWTFDAVADDRYLLTSDGLTNELSDAHIGDVLAGGGTPEVVCEELVEAANDHGGQDNITVVVADVVEGSRRRFV